MKRSPDLGKNAETVQRAAHLGFHLGESASRRPGAQAECQCPALGVNGSGMAVAAWYYGGTNVNADVYANIWR